MSQVRAGVQPVWIAGRTLRRINVDGVGTLFTAITLTAAALWAFPLYWGVVTSLKQEEDVITSGIGLLPNPISLQGYAHAIFDTSLGVWYINSLVTSISVTLLVIVMSAGAGYAISQLNFPGRRVLWWCILASFMVPIQTLIITHYVLITQIHLLNTWLGVILPQLIAPITVITYKQFFDSVPKELREAAVVDGASEVNLLFRIYLPMNWGVTTAIAIITFIGAWNNFLWPFLAVNSENMMNVSVGITQVSDAFGVKYARDLSTALLACLPVVTLYLIFQRRVTEAIMLSAGIKG